MSGSKTRKSAYRLCVPATTSGGRCSTPARPHARCAHESGQPTRVRRQLRELRLEETKVGPLLQLGKGALDHLLRRVRQHHAARIRIRRHCPEDEELGGRTCRRGSRQRSRGAHAGGRGDALADLAKDVLLLFPRPNVALKVGAGLTPWKVALLDRSGFDAHSATSSAGASSMHGWPIEIAALTGASESCVRSRVTEQRQVHQRGKRYHMRCGLRADL